MRQKIQPNEHYKLIMQKTTKNSIIILSNRKKKGAKHEKEC